MKKIALFALVLPLVAASLRAQLATWNFSGTDATTQNPQSGVLGTNINSATITLGSGVSPSGTFNTFGGTGFNTTSLGAAITAGDYLSFTVTPSTGYSMSLTTLSFNPGLSSGTSFNIALLSSVTGFSSGDSLFSYSFSTASPPAQTVTLTSNAAFQSLAQSVEFRLYGWRDTTGSSTFAVRDLMGNDLVVNGTTGLSAIPEPSTYALIFGSAALVGAMLWRRRQAGR